MLQSPAGHAAHDISLPGQRQRVILDVSARQRRLAASRYLGHEPRAIASRSYGAGTDPSWVVAAFVLSCISNVVAIGSFVLGSGRSLGRGSVFGSPRPRATRWGFGRAFASVAQITPVTPPLGSARPRAEPMPTWCESWPIRGQPIRPPPGPRLARGPGHSATWTVRRWR